MTQNSRAAVTELPVEDGWVEDLDAPVPEGVTEDILRQENKKQHRVRLGISEFPAGREVKFFAELTDTLREVFSRAAGALNKALLPPDSPAPLDRLRCRERGGSWGDPLAALEQPLWLVLANGCTRHFSIEYVLAVKINARWGIAPSEQTTPRELLTAFGFNPAEFSLYHADSPDLLNPDIPLLIKRGETFEAQKDGRYGSGAQVLRPKKGAQTIQDDLSEAEEAGVKVRLLAEGGQQYVEVRGIQVPSPPWSRPEVNILIPVPATYPSGGLDAFYLESSLRHASGSIPGQQSTVFIDGASWTLVSWHYASNRPWNPFHDDLNSHISHCRGYFLRRGVSQ